MTGQPRLLARDVGLTEGPVFMSNGDVAAVSIDRGEICVISDGVPRVLATTGGGPNGATEGHDGCLYVAQNGGVHPARRWPGITGGVQVVRPGGLVHWLTQDPIAPNDLCFGPDGQLYVTDPTRDGLYSSGRIWRIDPVTGTSEMLASVDWYPNGIGFGLGDDALYVASSGDATIRRMALTTRGLGASEVVIEMSEGRPDGFAFDGDGNVIVASVAYEGQAGTVQTWSSTGRLLDVLRPGASQHYTNVALSADRELLITDSTEGSVLIVEGWPRAGLALHPFRDGT